MTATPRSRVHATPLVASAVLLLVALLAASGAPAATLASCALPPGAEAPSLDDAEIVIVGTVIATVDDGRVATVAVEEVWRGPEFPAQVIVRGGFGTGDMWTSGDRTFQAGVRYLFSLSLGEAGALQDNACSTTVEWSDDLAAARPADARSIAVTATGELQAIELGAILGPVVVVIVVAGVLLLAGLAVRGREA